MKIVGVIPARWASTRLAGKVLADIQGCPMIQHVWRRAKQSRILEEVFIACDNEKVFKAAQNFGAKAIMTSPELPSGTDRVAEVIKDMPVEIVLNIQGDEPLVHPQMLDALAKAIAQDPSCQMATLIRRISREEEIHNPSMVKVVIDRQANALYFSRSAVPFDREGVGLAQAIYYKHFGIYAYRKEFLLRFKDLPQSALERVEKLEQLRVLEAGFKIKTVVTMHDTVGVDTKEDLARVAELMKGAA